MDDKFNTTAGWILGAGIVALGLSSISGHIFGADKHHRPEKMGYAIEGVVEEGEAGEAAVPIETLLASADATKGEQVFKKCAACHTINQGGANGIGPNLYGTMGEPIGKGKAGYAFSPALSGKGGNWDWTAMDQWLTNPKKFAEGTKMTFAGLSSGEDRANLMVYLNAQGSSLPLPAAPAAAEPADGGKADGSTAPATTGDTAPAPGDPKAAGAVAGPTPGPSAAEAAAPKKP